MRHCTVAAAVKNTAPTANVGFATCQPTTLITAPTANKVEPIPNPPAMSRRPKESSWFTVADTVLSCPIAQTGTVEPTHDQSVTRKPATGGKFGLSLAAIPAVMVDCAAGQPRHAPLSRSVTTPLRTSTKEIVPPWLVA